MSRYEISVNGAVFVVEVGDVSSSPVTVTVNGEPKSVTFQEMAAQATQPLAASPRADQPAATAPAPQPTPSPATTPAGTTAGDVVKAPMPGKVLSVQVQVGAQVREGQTLCTIEAMKMEMPISSTTSGTVKAVHVAVGDNVAYDDALVTLG